MPAHVTRNNLCMERKYLWGQEPPSLTAALLPERLCLPQRLARHLAPDQGQTVAGFVGCKKNSCLPGGRQDWTWRLQRSSQSGNWE